MGGELACGIVGEEGGYFPIGEDEGRDARISAAGHRKAQTLSRKTPITKMLIIARAFFPPAVVGEDGQEMTFSLAQVMRENALVAHAYAD
jgi:hypothetical protein